LAAGCLVSRALSVTTARGTGAAAAWAETEDSSNAAAKV
jgi:hypothetical protein